MIDNDPLMKFIQELCYQAEYHVSIKDAISALGLDLTEGQEIPTPDAIYDYLSHQSFDRGYKTAELDFCPSEYERGFEVGYNEGYDSGSHYGQDADFSDF